MTLDVFTDDDTEFHTPDSADHEWAETNSFAITIPEERVMAFFYVLVRRGLGVMLNDVSVFGGLAGSRAELLYLDSRQHLPAAQSLARFSSASGLSITAKSIRDYSIDYVGLDGVEAHLDFAGLMEPFDTADPDHSPMVKAHDWSADKAPAHRAMYANHFDLTGRITGTLTIGGRELEVDCVETMDHSWGPRPEMEMRSGSWMHAHFGPDFAVHWITSLKLDAPADTASRLRHGYVMENGQVYGLTDLRLEVNRAEGFPMSIDAVATDVRGTTTVLHGSAVAGGPWSPYTSTVLTAAMMRWTMLDGRIGWGVVQENIAYRQLNKLHARRWTDPLKVGAL
ncbi:hypothetical protein GCU56_03035 [Geodermatophilus sabuli]|uniref:Uncharacterized protein n=1 Tax=Geodermatophilus sabuli TaxID=1564158 RepID=A0A7K3VW32_9ACTN|nr:hypothetical protein [Geodermatophilus sabuli]NEK56846.1 hypothetical protein [Geodermatophilus sabuli]